MLFRTNARTKVRKVDIYDWANVKRTVVIPDKPLAEIQINIISGDEVVKFIYEDGMIRTCDASRTRNYSDFQYSYHVEGKNIEKWMNFVPGSKKNIVYQRYDVFRKEVTYYE